MSSTSLFFSSFFFSSFFFSPLFFSLLLNEAQSVELKTAATSTPLENTFYHNLNVIEDLDFEDSIGTQRDYLVFFSSSEILDEVQNPLLDSFLKVSEVFLSDPVSFVACVIHTNHGGIETNPLALKYLSPSPPPQEREGREEREEREERSSGSVGSSATPTGDFVDSQFVLFTKQKEDRSCLLSPPPLRSEGVFFAGQKDGEETLEEALVKFVNSKTGTYRNVDGSLNEQGLLIKKANEEIFTSQESNTCAELDASVTKKNFLSFLRRAQPAVIRGAVSHWPASTLWTNEYLRGLVGDRLVHIKITPNGEFEGCDLAENWEDHEARVLPERVVAKLSFPDMVVVRPAPHDLPFSDFMDIIETRDDINAYLEYTSLASYLPSLLKDIDAPKYVEGILNQQHLNIWLGNGKTVGKLHFDPFDNFLCQVTGEKTLILYDPAQSANLYEGHIPEAQFDFSFETGKFAKKTLLESTSMVMSPVDISAPDLDKFPLFASAVPTTVTIKAGDCLFLPAFWWHEVRSKPDGQRRNIAVNYWYEPFFTKEFPCPTCPRTVNPTYVKYLDQFSPVPKSPVAPPTERRQVDEL